jgi:2-polyprenyl-6-methoxyphenol hydroxylase-like FAD-dependent oxidoreductase
MSSPTVLIAGGGIAGTATALAIHKAGLGAVIHEARPEAQDGGAFLPLASNGIDALRTLGADRPVLAAGFPTPAITLRSGTGKRLGAARTGGTLADGTVSHTIARADLHRALLDEVEARGIEVVRGVNVSALDGADVIVGADGVHSTVRALIDPRARGASVSSGSSSGPRGSTAARPRARSAGARSSATSSRPAPPTRCGGSPTSRAATSTRRSATCSRTTPARPPR